MIIKVILNFFKKCTIDNYSKSDKSLVFFSYILGGFGSNIGRQLKNIVDATDANGSTISVMRLRWWNDIEKCFKRIKE